MAPSGNVTYGYLSTVTTGSTTNAGTISYPVTAGGGYTDGVTYVGGGGGGYAWPAAKPEPQPQSALEWLDAEVEKTCALARAA